MIQKQPSYLDILNGVTRTPLSAGVAVDLTPATPSLPLDSSPVITRFRSQMAAMQTIAKDSAKQEVIRIISLPIIEEPTEEVIELVSRRYCPAGTFKFYPEQVKAMIQYWDYGGLVAPIPVGGGKTLVSVLIASDAYVHFNKHKILLMNPPNLIDQLRETELPYYRRHMSINVPFYWLAGQNAQKRMLMAKSNRRGCYVVSYSILSGKQGAELLDAIAPDLVIGDEIHSIASANPSARGRRFKAMVKKFNPQIVGLSGTITKKSPRDYHHLAVNALRENCFLPRPVGMADEWAKLIDSNASSIDEFHNNQAPQPGPIKPMMDWASKHFPDQKFPNNLIGFRAAFNIRKDTCPGVVASSGEDLGVSLRITNTSSKNDHEFRSRLNNEDSVGWEKLQDIIKELLTRWVAPNGDEIEHAMLLWKWRYELQGFGFYNNLFWSDVSKVASRKGITNDQAQDLLDRSIEHHLLQQEYHKLLRSWITKRARKGLDTPMLIGLSMHNDQSKFVGGELYRAWVEMKEATFEGILEREKAVVRVCDFRIRKVVEWAKKWYAYRPNKATIIWFKNNGVAKWIHEAFIEADLPVIHCPAGPKGKALLVDRGQGNKFAIASISAHHKGLNLQYHHDTEMYAQFPREAHIAEQSIGRVHRNQQASDTVRVFVDQESEFDTVLFAACLNDAAYIHQTSSKQKLIYADYDEQPTIVPWAVLSEWGTQAQQLSTDANKLLTDKFKGE